MDANVKNDEFAKLSLMDRVAYGLGDFAQNLVFGTVGGFLLFYLSTVNGISAATGATIFLIVRLVNVVWDPWVGATVDRRDPKGGKYLPYIRNFGIPLVILAAMLFLPFGQWFPAIKLPFAFLSYLATAMIYSFVNIPYGALNASLTRDNEEIAKLTTVRMTLANVANLMVYTLFPLFVQLATSVGRESKDIGMFGIHLNLGNYASPQSAGAWFKVYAVYMVIGFIALMITYSKTKERVLPEKNQEQVKYSDLFAEFKRNKPLQILGLFFKLGLALGGIIPGYINAATGFDGAKKVQSATALMGVQWSMVWLPIIMAIVAGIIIAKYPLTDDKVAEMNHEIENRRNNK